MDKNKWSDTNWKNIRDNYPNAKVLKSGQDFERPTEWKKNGRCYLHSGKLFD